MVILSYPKRKEVTFMEITFEVSIIIGNNAFNRDTKTYTFDYDIIKDDLDEFATKMGYKNGFEIIKEDSKDLFEDDNEEFERAKHDYENATYLVENYFSKSTEKEFANFIARKYQEKFEEWLLQVITHNSDKNLNDLIYYNFME